jgi:hypothetical protein
MHYSYTGHHRRFQNPITASSDDRWIKIDGDGRVITAGSKTGGDTLFTKQKEMPQRLHASRHGPTHCQPSSRHGPRTVPPIVVLVPSRPHRHSAAAPRAAISLATVAPRAAAARRIHRCSPSCHRGRAPTVAAAHAIVVLMVLRQGRRRCGPVIIVLWPYCATTTAARRLCRLLRLRGPHAAATSRCCGRAPPLQQLAPPSLESPSQQLALLEGEGVSTGEVEGEGEGESDRAWEGEREYWRG